MIGLEELVRRFAELDRAELARWIERRWIVPEAQREAFLLSEEGGLTLKEIAQTMGVNVETAKSRLRYAVAKLRAGFKDASRKAG